MRSRTPLDDLVEAAKADWSQAEPWVAVLMVLMVIDVVLGVIAAWHGKGKHGRRLDSHTMGKGLMVKTATLLALGAMAVMDGLVAGVSLTLALSMAFVGREGLSILETLGKMGVGLPKTLMDRLEALQGSGPVEVKLADEPVIEGVAPRKVEGDDEEVRRDG